jgi:asparagine synthase (glutamine-hydrolysing)
MCAIVGMFSRTGREVATEFALRRMLGPVRHRGPDEFGILVDRETGLGSARLCIIDPDGGSQPIANEDESLWIVFNGEVFNYLELREELLGRGHQFRTATDTEVILHLFEESGPGCLEKLNGQFAIAIWDVQRRRLFLARDRFGVRPLFYTETGDRTFLFASEIKALLGNPHVTRELSGTGLAEVFTFWAAQAPNTVFRGIHELPPGHWLFADSEGIQIISYWSNEFPAGSNIVPARKVEDLVEQLRTLLIDACRIRLRADVPLGAYLSGGLDSSTIVSAVQRHMTNRMATFSIAFADEAFDESVFQLEMARHLGTDHHVVRVAHAEIGRVFPDVIWHAESPLMRTAAAPMYLLSELVRQTGFKVVLTGEGADEFLAGYDIFKEAKVRRFWARQPRSKIRSRLLQRLYPDISGLARTNLKFLAAFFGEGLQEVAVPWYSHLVRWRNNQRTLRFFNDGFLPPPQPGPFASMAARLPANFGDWAPLSQAQHLEISTFLSQYLLSSQGDRMGMAHSVEGRFPFLDVRLVEFCNRLPPGLKLRGLQEKYILKLAAKPWLPERIQSRLKRPYRAPIHRSFFAEPAPDYVDDLLSAQALKGSGYFRPAAVEQLVRKIRRGASLGETDDMALVGILSTQLLHHQFIEHFGTPRPLAADEPVKVCRLKPRAGNHELQYHSA